VTPTHLVGHTKEGDPFHRTAAELLRNTAFEGAGNAGKTTAALDALEFLFRTEPTLPVLVLDGVGTLSQGLYQRLLARIAQIDATGRDVTPQRARLLFLRIQSENTSGVSFDLLKLRETVDDLGRKRLETYKERVETIVSTLAHMTPGSDEFKLVRLYAPAVLTALVAGHRPVTEFPYLLRPGMQSYWMDLRERIDGFAPIDCARGCTDGSYLSNQLQTLEALYAIPPREWERLVGSTVRHFQWLWQDFAAFFARDTLDYAAFHDAGGFLLVDSAHADPSAAAMVRRALYAVRYAHLVGRPPAASGPRFAPSLVVIDEQQGMNADLYAAIVANARNRSDYHWFLYQNPEQLGERGEHYDAMLSVMQTRVYFRPGSPKAADTLAWMVSRMDPAALRLPTIAKQRGRSRDASEQASESAAHVTTDTWSEDDDTARSHAYAHEIRDGSLALVRHEARDTAPATRSGGSVSVSHVAGRSRGTRQGQQDGVTASLERVGIAEQLTMLARRLHNLPTRWAYYVDPPNPPVLVRHAASPMIGSPDEVKKARIAQRERLRKPRRFTMPRAPKPPAPPPDVAPATAPGQAKRRRKRVDAASGGQA
jgi:hypothetical protein